MKKWMSRILIGLGVLGGICGGTLFYIWESPQSFRLEGREDTVELLPDFFNHLSERIEIEKPPAHGQLTETERGFQYMPDRNYWGGDFFTYRLQQFGFFSDPQTVRLYIRPVNDPPALKKANLFLKVRAGQSIRFRIEANDPDDEILRFFITNPPQLGDLINHWPDFVYQATPGVSGNDLIHYEVMDTFGEVVKGTIRFEIEPPSIPAVKAPAVLSKAQLACLNQVPPLVKNGAVAVGNQFQFETQPGAFYLPASLLKIATSAAVLSRLSPSFRFKTPLYHDSSTATVYLQGSGDPTLNSSDYQRILQRISNRQAGDVKRLILDFSMFGEALTYYDRKRSLYYFEAPLSALAVNRNALNIIKRKGRLRPLIPVFPVTEELRMRLKRMPDGRQYLPLADRAEKVPLFLIKMLGGLLGETPSIAIEVGDVPDGLSPSWSLESEKELGEIIRYMLKYSDNFIANQLLLTAAHAEKLQPVDLRDGKLLLEHFLEKEVGVSSDDFKVVEGSGLSRQNRLRLVVFKKLLSVLEKELWNNLPLMSESKYSKLAEILNSEQIKAKTGSLHDVFNIAGYFDLKGKRVPFVIILNQKENGRANVMKTVTRCVYQGTGA